MNKKCTNENEQTTTKNKMKKNRKMNDEKWKTKHKN